MNTKTWFEIIAKCGQPEKTTDCVIAKCGIKSKGLSPCFWNHSSQYYRAGQFFWRGSEMGNGAKISGKAGLPVTILKWHGLQLKIRVEVKAAFGIVSLWFGLRRKIERSRNRDSSVFARKWNEFIFCNCFVSVFVAYELIFCAFVPVLSTVYTDLPTPDKGKSRDPWKKIWRFYKK